MKNCCIVLLLFLCSDLYACNGNQRQLMEMPVAVNLEDTLNRDSMNLKITIGEHVFFATLYDNPAVTAFKAKLPMTIHMTELNGNEKYGDLPVSLPTNASNPGTIQTGDLMLYGSNTLVIFYKTFPTSYSYTRLGRIDPSSGLATALGTGNVVVNLELE